MVKVRTADSALALIAVLVATLGACTGWPSSPDASGLPDTQVGGYCTSSRLGAAAGKDIEAPSGVRIAVQPLKDKLNGTILLDVRILVPDAVTVRLQPPELLLDSPGWPAPRRLAVHHVTTAASRTFDATSALAGSAVAADSTFTLWFDAGRDTQAAQTGIAQPATFTLQLPELEIDGRAFRPEPVTFHSYRKMPVFSCAP